MKVFKILLIEDNEGDAILTLEAFKHVGLKCNVEVLTDGELALNYLITAKTDSKPDLILLDINLPKVNGIEVLRNVKQDGFLRTIPVVVLTTSNSHQDLNDAYSNHANSYMIKPMDLFVFIDHLKVLCDYWFRVIKRHVESV